MSRIKIKEKEPKLYAAMFHLSHAVAQTTIEPKIIELIKIRASQINGCGFCLDMHTRDALKLGEDAQRIYTLSAWREAPFYPEAEQAALALTEEITHISAKGVSDEAYAQAAKYFDENQLAQLIMAIVAINAWNRIAVSTHLYPEKGSM